MKIAFHLNCLERGGAERVASILAGRFAKDGQDVTMATEWTGADEFTLDPGVRRVHVGLTAADEKKNRLQSSSHCLTLSTFRKSDLESVAHSGR